MFDFNVGTDWPIGHLRSEVEIAMGNSAPLEFCFLIREAGQADRKINRRKERTMTVVDILPPRALKLKIQEA